MPPAYRRAMLRSVRPSVCLSRFLILSRSLYGSICASSLQTHSVGGSAVVTSECYRRGIVAPLIPCLASCNGHFLGSLTYHTRKCIPAERPVYRQHSPPCPVHTRPTTNMRRATRLYDGLQSTRGAGWLAFPPSQLHSCQINSFTLAIAGHSAHGSARICGPTGQFTGN